MNDKLRKDLRLSTNDLPDYVRQAGLRLVFTFIVFSSSFIAVSAQTENITIHGRALDHNSKRVPINIMVVNQQTGTGTFANPDGSFSLSANRKDTIMITARDYSIKKICFRDSGTSSTYNIVVRLDSIHYDLAEVQIYPTRTLPQIHKDIDQLGNVPNTDTYKDVPFTSPITLLYERFSRIEQSKRKVAQMEDQERMRQVLKDLLHLYIKNDIINLSDKDFDRFIDYCNLPEDFIKQATDYELVMAIKQKYQLFQRQYSNDYH
jgi:hypothetical protein